MADAVLSFAHGAIFLDGICLPGLLTSLSVRGQVRYDLAEQDGLSGKTKTPLGWEDDSIILSLALTSEDESTCYDKLRIINGWFSGQDSSGNPMVLRVANPHLLARGISEVVFDGLESSETDQDDIINASLKFSEHNPPVVKTEVRAAATGAAPSTSAAEVDVDQRLMVDVE